MDGKPNRLLFQGGEKVSDKEKQIPIYRPSQFEDALSWNAGHSQGLKDGRKAAEAENKALRELVKRIKETMEAEYLDDYEFYGKRTVIYSGGGMLTREEEIDDYFAEKDKGDEKETT